MNFPSLHRGSVLLTVLLVTLSPLSAQEKTLRPTVITVVKNGWSEKGDLVLGVRIRAGSKQLTLGKIEIAKEGPPIISRYSMADAKLVDTYSGQVIAALPSLPHSPFFGTMEGCITLNSGDAITFGAAFPHPPNPPKDKEGKQLDYQFELQTPGQEPISFSIPFTQS